MINIFETVLRLSLSTGVLGLLVLGARQIIGRRPGVFLPVLYALVIAKLLIPISIESTASIENIWNNPNTQTITHTEIDTGPAADTTEFSAAEETITTIVQPDIQTYAAAGEISPVPNTQAAPALTLIELALIFWLAGMAALTACIVSSNIRFTRMLKRNRTYTDISFDTLLAECKRSVGIRQHISVIQVSEISTAAVYGIFRPKLLISPRSFDKLSNEEKRYVLLHELMHIKRRDTLTCLLLTALNVIHWFNPVVWLTFALIRRDLEVLCDAAVLKKIGDSKKHGYASTLLYLAQIPAAQTPRLATALFISKTSITRRITMITRYKKKSVLFSIIALALTLAIAVTGCTTAIQNTPEDIQNKQETSGNQTQTTIEQSSGNNHEGLKLLTSHTLAYNEDLPESFIHNLKKAAGLLDGTIIAHQAEMDLLNVFAPITEQNGWETAETVSWYAITHGWETAESITPDAVQVGGGLDLTILAVLQAAEQTNGKITTGIGMSGNDYTSGHAIVKNETSTDILISVGLSENTLIVEIYSGDIPIEQEPSTTDTEPELMTSYALDYSSHRSTSTIYNVTKALELLNDTIIAPGETLSLNTILGPRTAEYGWQAAAGIVNGAFTEQIGGGISAVSSALYNAAIRTELEIVERAPHTIPCDYITPGLDATISTGGPDLKIKNPYSMDITISASIKDATITIDIYGPSMDYTVDFDSELVDRGDEPETDYIYDSTQTPNGDPIPEGGSILWANPRISVTCDVYKTITTQYGTTSTSLFEVVTYPEYRGKTYVNGPERE